MIMVLCASLVYTRHDHGYVCQFSLHKSYIYASLVYTRHDHGYICQFSLQNNFGLVCDNIQGMYIEHKESRSKAISGS